MGRKITTLYTLNLHNITCQLPLNKKGETVITVQKLPQWPFQVLALVVKIPAANAGDTGDMGWLAPSGADGATHGQENEWSSVSA